MSFQIHSFSLSFLIFLSCSTGKLSIIANAPSSLEEISAAETTSKSALIWVIEDAGNKNILYGLDTSGTIKKELKITNAENKDWEDLTSDNFGNIYIGDIGNNKENRNTYTIYKIANPENSNVTATAEIIEFKLPKKMKEKDFEGFFLHENNFYLFSKETKDFKVFSVPNAIGSHKATLVSEFNLEGKNNKITSADISDDGKKIVLLNHEKLWLLTDFEGDNFFEGKITQAPFNHDTQKEGICFKNNTTVLITDEQHKNDGGNIYEFSLN